MHKREVVEFGLLRHEFIKPRVGSKKGKASKETAHQVSMFKRRNFDFASYIGQCAAIAAHKG